MSRVSQALKVAQRESERLTRLGDKAKKEARVRMGMNKKPLLNEN